MRLLRVAALLLPLCVSTVQLAEAQTWPAAVTVASIEGGRVGSTAYRSSSRLQVSWTAPPAAVHRYILTLADGVTGASVAVETAETRVTVTGLKSGTTHTVTLKVCLDEACATSLDADAPASGQTADEYWQVQGTGNSYGTATKIYADGGVSGDPATVDFEDWEQVAQAREVHVLWPDGSTLNVASESTLDDYMMFMPTGNPSLQIMYSNMSIPGSGLAPFIGMAVLVNP